MKYDILQTLNYHNDTIWKVIELKNNSCTSLIQTKDNEICYSEFKDRRI